MLLLLCHHPESFNDLILSVYRTKVMDYVINSI